MEIVIFTVPGELPLGSDSDFQQPVTPTYLDASRGEMAMRIRQFDWAKTSVGPIDKWPQALTAAVQICLGSRFPMFVWWGPDLIYFYNDAYAPVLGKRHPEALGKPAKTIWKEIWPVIEPQAEAVLLRGEATWNERVMLLLERNGFQEETYFSWSYSPVYDEHGKVAGLFCVSTDETARVKAEAELTRAEQRFRVMADGAPVLIWVAGIDKRANWFNKPWLEFTGRTIAQALSEGWAQSVHPDDLNRSLSTYLESFDARRPFTMDYRLRRHDGEYRWILDHGTPLIGADGAFTGYVGSCVDITERRQVEVERETLLAREREARTQAERASSIKDEFLATLSHELRTPLNAILGWSQILRSSDDQTDLQEGLAIIERNARAQTQIIEDLLDMSRIISGKIRLDVQRLGLASLVEAALATVRPAADAKGIRLRSVLDPLAGPISGDPNRIQQVFWNLLNNAIKFTGNGGQVQVLLERVNSHLEVSVIDTGEGIHPDFLPHVFDRFRQADASKTRRHGGLGIGLSIVKQLVELHGGSVRAKSGGPGKGSTFTVMLPVTVIHGDPETSGTRQHPESSAMSDGAATSCLKLDGVKILVVDDEPDARSLVRRVLEDCDAVVTTAASVDEALTRFRSAVPDVLISDIGMPGKDGFALIRAIRAMDRAQGGNVPAIALTAFARLEDRVTAVQSGFQMHMSKPVEPVELITIVASLVQRGK